MAIFEIKLISAAFMLLSLFLTMSHSCYMFHVIKMVESRHLFTYKWFICSCFSGNRDGKSFFFIASPLSSSVAIATAIVLNLECVLIMTWVKPSSLSFPHNIQTLYYTGGKKISFTSPYNGLWMWYKEAHRRAREKKQEEISRPLK